MKIKSKEHIFDFGSRKISYRLYRADRKKLRIVVSPDLSVDVFAPKTATDPHIRKAIKKKAPWIARSIDKLEGYHPLPTPKRYVSGETLVYLGRQYRLKVENGNKEPAKLRGRFLYVGTKDKTDRISVKKVVDEWYRKRAKDVLGRYMEKCLNITSRHGISEPFITIRLMRSRWGSCSPTGRITLNLKLVQLPVQCIEYVIMHELCHLKFPNHSKLFYSFLTRCLPDWRKRKETLDRVRLS
ncbi:M48 family metallopeptidase [Thermodesulfobacteriota bacterium]